MQIKIHQIKGVESIKNIPYAFRGWELAKDKFNIKDYNFCYEYDIDGVAGKSVTDVLEELFEIFNLNHPSDFKGHSFKEVLERIASYSINAKIIIICDIPNEIKLVTGTPKSCLESGIVNDYDVFDVHTSSSVGDDTFTIEIIPNFM